MKKPKTKTVELVKSRYQPSQAELQEDLRINTTPVQAAKSVMQRVKAEHISSPKDKSD